MIKETSKENSKAKAQQAHANRRALERFGVCLDPATVRRLIAAIQSGQAPHLWKTSNRVSVFQSELAGQPCKLVYDRKRKTIVSILTMDADHELGVRVQK